MGEDGLRNRENNGPETLALMRKLALNLARLTDGGRETSMRSKLKRARRGDGLLLKLVTFAASLAENAEPEQVQLGLHRPLRSSASLFPDEGDPEESTLHDIGIT